MKNCIKSVIILIAGLSALASTPLSAASKFDLPIVFSVRALTATREGGDQIERGSSRFSIRPRV